MGAWTAVPPPSWAASKDKIAWAVEFLGQYGYSVVEPVKKG